MGGGDPPGQGRLDPVQRLTCVGTVGKERALMTRLARAAFEMAEVKVEYAFDFISFVHGTCRSLIFGHSIKRNRLCR